MFGGQAEKVEGAVVFDRQQGLSLDAVGHVGVKVGLAVQILGLAVVVEMLLQHAFGPAEACRRAQVELTLQVALAAGQNDKIFDSADFSNQRMEFWLAGRGPSFPPRPGPSPALPGVG